MKNRNSESDANKEFHHRPTIHTSKTTAGKLPNVELYDNDALNEQKNKIDWVIVRLRSNF